MTKYLINERYDVENPEDKRVFEKGETRKDFADAWQATGNIILIGLAGSGKKSMAKLLGERTGLPVSAPDVDVHIIDALGGENQILVIEDEFLRNSAIQSLVHSAGKVFYLMADTNTLATRLAQAGLVEDREQAWRDLSARLVVMEPIYYSLLHFILQAVETPEVLVHDALEKIAY